MLLFDIFFPNTISSPAESSPDEHETTKIVANDKKKIDFDLNDNPDLAQTIVVTSFGLNIPTKLTGLSTLKVKETNRLEALYNELTKLGAKCKITNDSIEIFKLKKYYPIYLGYARKLFYRKKAR